MIIGIGIDSCSICRIEKIMDREGIDGAFFRRTFTEAERREAELRHHRAEFYAARFAVKEAVFKAVSPHLEAGFDLRKVESLHREDGSPYVSLTETLTSYMKEAGIRTLHLSVTTEGGLAQAIVLAEG